MADRLEGANQLNEILFQDPIDSFPLRDNFRKTTDVIASHATSIEALENGGSPPASSSAEVIAARDDFPDLQTALRKPDEILGDGIIEGVTGEFLIKETTAAPDDKFEVDTGEAIINGAKVKATSVQTVDPPDFTAASLERIDAVEVGSSGTASTTTGAEVAVGSGLSEIERSPDNTGILGFVFMRSEASSPFAPRPIRNTDNGTDSFVIPNLQRFFLQRDRTDAHRHPSNLLRNGAFISTDVTNTVVEGWTSTRGTLVLDPAETLFGDNSGKFTGDGTTGGNFIEQELRGPNAIRGHFISVSSYMKLDSGAAKTARITIRLVGDTPESDFSQTFSINSEKFQRGHVTGFIDNSVTAVFVRLELDTTDSNTTVGFFEGAMASAGLILTEFEYPERMRINDQGAGEFPGGAVTADIEFEQNLAWQFPPPMDIFSNVKVFTGT